MEGEQQHEQQPGAQNDAAALKNGAEQNKQPEDYTPVGSTPAGSTPHQPPFSDTPSPRRSRSKSLSFRRRSPSYSPASSHSRRHSQSHKQSLSQRRSRSRSPRTTRRQGCPMPKEASDSEHRFFHTFVAWEDNIKHTAEDLVQLRRENHGVPSPDHVNQFVIAQFVRLNEKARVLHHCWLDHIRNHSFLSTASTGSTLSTPIVVATMSET